MAHAESRGLELAVGLALPATLGLIVLSEPIVRLLFEHGAFTAADTAATARALMWLALGLPAHVLVKALSPAFFAREDTMTPLLATLKGIVRRDRGRASLLGHLFGAGGIAAGDRARRLEQRAVADPAWRGDLRLFDRCGGTAAAAAHRRWRRSRWAGCCGWRRVSPLPVSAARTALCRPRLLLVLIAGGIAIYGLLLAASRRHRLARSGLTRSGDPRRRTTCAHKARVANDGAKQHWEADHGHSLNGFFQASSRRAICISATTSARSSIS